MTKTLPDHSPATGPAHPDEDPPVSALFHRLYAFLYNKFVGVVLILAMAITSLLGALLQQVPDAVRDDPQSFAAWLEQVRPRYGGWTDILATLGLFNVFSSWWFRALTVLLAASIIACTTHRLPQLWARATKPHLHVADSLFEHARYRSDLPLPAAPAEASARLRELLEARRYRVLADPQDAASVYADRWRWMPFGTAVAHLGFVVIIAGVLVSSVAGFSDPGVSVTVGQRVAVGHDTGLTVEAKGFTDTYYEDGRPKDYASDLVLYSGDRVVAEKTIRVNDPLRHDGIAFYQSYFGTSAVVRATDAAGKELYSGGIALEQGTSDGRNVYGRFTPAGTNLVVFAATAASGRTGSTLRPGEVEFAVYDPANPNTPLGVRTVAQGQSATIGDITYSFVREAPFTGLQISRDPGAIWVWLGSLLTILGMLATMFFKHRRVWARVVPDADGGSRVLLAAPERNDTVFERWFRTLVTDLDASWTTTGKDHRHG